MIDLLNNEQYAINYQFEVIVFVLNCILKEFLRRRYYGKHYYS